MADLFKDIIASIKNGKEKCEFEDNEYAPFIVNKALSYYTDSLFDAKIMTLLHNLPKKMQYDFLYHSVRKKYRPFVPWEKKTKEDDVAIIAEYTGLSMKKARSLVSLYNESDIAVMRKTLDKGGITKTK